MVQLTTTSLGPDDEFTCSVAVGPDRDASRLADAVAEAIEGAARPQVWLESAQPGENELLAPLGLEPYRDLHQLRRPLPADPSGLDTRAFRVGHDEAAFIEVNNRAFSWHPEQSGLTLEALQQTMSEPWFDPDGFRLHERDGRLAGFCWTKVHADHDPVMGEIYVIAVDPDFGGQGLGGPMTLAGLEHLSSAGITLANLYVESDNEPAQRVYERLGFNLHAINRAYRRVAS